MRVPEEKLKQIELWVVPAADGPRILKAAELTKQLVADIRELQGRLMRAGRIPYAQYLRGEGSLPDEAGAAQGSGTSAIAARMLAGKLGELQQKVLDCIRACGEEGATDDEIEKILGMRHQTASARRRELVLGEVIIDSGRTRINASKRPGTVWVVAPERTETANPASPPKEEASAQLEIL